MTQDLFKSSKKQPYKKCCHSHPVLKLGHGEIVGAACGSPRPGYDIYIGFDYGMKFEHQKYPWNEIGDPVIEIQFRITDGCAPKDKKEFKKMVHWVADQLDEGKKIHVGCIGGHGRTGLFLAALVSLYEDLTDDPIAWVRKNHCKKAVESESQVKFLVKHFKCKTAEPSKPKDYWGGTQTGRYYGGQKTYSDYKRGPLSSKDVVADFPKGKRISCMEKKGSIWG